MLSSPPRAALVASMLSLLYSMTAMGSDNEPDLFSLDIDELVNIRISSAAKTSDTIAAAPASISVITKEQIRSSGARRWFDLIEHVVGWTGLNGNNSSRSFVVRGVYTENGVLVLVDGTAVNDPFSGRFDLFDLPLSLIERIEIVRGPGSAMFGGNALIGVINIITHRDDVTASTQTRLAAGDQSFRGASAEWHYRNSDWSLSVDTGVEKNQQEGESLTLKQDQFYTTTPGRFLPPLVNPSLTPTSRNENINTLSAYTHINWHAFDANYFYGRTESTPLFSFRSVATEQGDTLRIDVINVLSLRYLSWQTEKWSLIPKLYYQLNQNKNLGDSLPPHILGDDNQDGLNEAFLSGIIESFAHDTRQYGTEIQWNYLFDNAQKINISISRDIAKLSFAEKMSNASFNSRSAISLFPIQDMSDEFIEEGIARRSTALSLEHRWPFSDALALTSSIRYNWFSDFGDASSPRIGLNYNGENGWYHKWLYSTAFLPPAFNQLFDRTPTLTSFRTRGNRELNASEIISYEWIAGREFSNGWRSEISWSHQDTKNEIFFNRQAGVERWQNGASRHSKAVELLVSTPSGKHSQIALSYAHQFSQGIDEGIAADIHPHHRFGLNYLWRSDNWQANFNVQYYGRAEREALDNRAPLASKTYVDLSLRRNGLWWFDSLQINFNNLFDEYGSDEINRAEGIAYDIPRVGRSVWLNLSKDWP